MDNRELLLPNKGCTLKPEYFYRYNREEVNKQRLQEYKWE